MRIAIVNDLRLALEALRRAVVGTGMHQVAWVAEDGSQAIEKARTDRPDLILMDMVMPGIDGVEATRRIMAESPCPILVVTATIQGNISKVFEALGCGALDVVETPTFGPKGELSGSVALLEKIRRIGHLNERVPEMSPKQAFDRPMPGRTSELPRLVLLGASTGGPKALERILGGLPETLPAAVVIAQHLDPGYCPGLATWLAEGSKLPVCLARDGEELKAGRVYLATSSHHVCIATDRRLRSAEDPGGLYYRPSVDVLFASAARHWPNRGVAVLLTGMGRDGASGLDQLRRAGWSTIAQDKESSAVWGMPRAAVELGAAAQVLPADRIAAAISSLIRPSP